MKLLTELAGDLSYGIATLRTREERIIAERRIAFLQRMALEIGVSEDFHSALKTAIQRVCEETGWIFGEVWMPSEDNTEMVCVCAWHEKDSALEKFAGESGEFTFLPGVGLSGRVWSSKKPAWSIDVTQNSNFPRSPLAEKVGLKSGIGIPVLAGDEVVAVLNFFVRDVRREDEKLIELISSVAAELGFLFKRKKAEEELRSTKESLAEAQRIAHIGNWDWNLVTGKIWWSPEMCRIFGVDEKTASQLEYETGFQRIHPEDREEVELAVKEALAGEKPFCMDYRLLLPDGVVKFVHAEGEVTFDNDRKPTRMVGVIQDVTVRKKMEEELRRLNEELEERVRQRTAELESANKELEAFSYSVSHDLRAPLRAIDGFSRILLEDYANELDDEGQRLLNVVRDNTQKMARLIDDLLAFSRVGRREPERIEIDMTHLARTAFDELRTLEPERKIQEDIQGLQRAVGDPVLLRQVFANLISNALKFTRNTPKAEIEIGSYNEGNETVYYVKDNGTGFDMKYADKLFGVFQRLHRAEEFEGTGVGLAIVQRIVHRQGGRVWAEGALNEGATFYFSLPVKEENNGRERPK